MERLKVWFRQGGGWWRPRRYLKAVDGIDLQLQRGKTLGIVGESGSGKSTLGQAILRLIASEGHIRFNGQALEGLEGRNCGRCADNCRWCSRTRSAASVRA